MKDKRPSHEQRIQTHSAPFDALVQLLDEVAEIRLAGPPHRLGAGDLIIMPAGQPHALQAFERFKMLLTMIRS